MSIQPTQSYFRQGIKKWTARFFFFGRELKVTHVFRVELGPGFWLDPRERPGIESNLAIFFRRVFRFAREVRSKGTRGLAGLSPFRPHFTSGVLFRT